MSYLFQQPVTVNTTVTLNSDNTAAPDVVLLAEGLWNSLSPSQKNDRIAVCITRRQPRPGSSRYSVLATSLVAWCRLERNVIGLAISEQALNHYPHIFLPNDLALTNPGKTHRVSVVNPVPLTKIVLLASSQEAYDAALSSASALEDWLNVHRSLLQQGDTIAIPSSFSSGHSDAVQDSNSFCFQLVATEPSLRGYIQKGRTSVYITVTEMLSNMEYIGGGTSQATMDDGIQEDFEISEGFLESSVWLCSAKSLASPVSLLADDCSVYIRTSDLSMIGVLNGDWAVVRPHRGTSYRLVRVIADDSLVHDSGSVSISPILLHNIMRKTGPTDSSQLVTIGFRCSPFGSRRPIVPVARSITVARIASPASTDRSNEALFLHALQTYFRQTPRLIKERDIIAVTISTDERHGMSEPTAFPEFGNDESRQDFNLMSLGSESPNEVVYFTVTNVEHEIFHAHHEILPDMYMDSTVGELGCWVDSTATRITQVGVEHSRIPHASIYLGITPSFSFESSQSFRMLLALSAAALSRNAADYHLHLSVLLQGARGTGKTTTALAVAQHLGMHLLEVDCYDILGETAVQSEAFLKSRFEKAIACSPCILVLKHVEAFSQTTQSLTPEKGFTLVDVVAECINDLSRSWFLTSFPVLVFATTSVPDQVPSHLLSSFKHQIMFESPEDERRLIILQSLLTASSYGPDVSLRDLAVGTAAFVASDLSDLITYATCLSARQMITTVIDHSYYDMSLPLIAANFEDALTAARASFSESIGAPQIPSVSWDDVGGMGNVKADILDTIQLPLEHPDLFASGLKKRSGILLYGPPGTGKTLLAKAVATSCSLNFFSVKGPELLNMYIGESEANVRRVFQRAKDARPCVIFFDELDSIAPKRGNQGDSGGVMDRIVSQLLAELDGISGGNEGSDVFVIGATNRPDLLDSALLRPGRFDRLLYLGVSNTHDAQLNILNALTRKFKLHNDLHLADIARSCSFHFTGADFYALCADALLKAMSRKAEEIETKIEQLNAAAIVHSENSYPITPQYYLAEIATSVEVEVLVSREDFELALDSLIPSVSPAEMEHYTDIQKQFTV